MSTSQERLIPREEISVLATQALKQAGASTKTAEVLVDAALFAEDRNMRGVGITHLLDYIRAIEGGRLNAAATPKFERLAPSIISCDARGGTFHAGFSFAFNQLVEAARSEGVAIFVQSGAFAGGQLGWFTEQLSAEGLVSFGVLNSNALLATGPGTGRVLGTNPMSYSIPRPDGEVITVDQSSSAAAFVNVRNAAETGEPIPEGWAVDSSGEPTTDAQAAVEGAMLPFGGYKGANIAWMVELFAGMSGANWSIDAPSFDSGSESPGVGMFIIAIDAEKFPNDYITRMDSHVNRLAELGVRTPGTKKEEALSEIPVRDDVLALFREYAGTAQG